MNDKKRKLHKKKQYAYRLIGRLKDKIKDCNDSVSLQFLIDDYLELCLKE